MTYLGLALSVIVVAVVIDLVITRSQVLKQSHTWKVLLIMVGLTILFNSFLTGLPIVLYQESKILGLYIGTIPLEDFSYTLFVVLVPITIKQWRDRA